MISAGRGGARVLVAHGALAQVGRAALAGLHRGGRARALLGGVGGRRERVRERRRRPRAARAAPRPPGRARRPSSCRPARPRRAPRRRPAPRRARRRAPAPSSAVGVAERAAGAAQRGAPQRAARAADRRDQRLARQDQQLAGRLAVVLLGERLEHRAEPAVHVDAVVAVADRGVQLRQVVGLGLDGGGDLAIQSST